MNTQTNISKPLHNIFNGFSKTALIFIVILIIFLFSISVRNKLARLDQGIKVAQGQIETDLNRRFDLVPNLVETVKGVAKQEQDVFGKIADARSRYAGAQNDTDKQNAMSDYQSALSRLLVITENYPELRSSEAFQGLMAQLEGTENRIAIARKDFNSAVEVYNKTIVVFPSNLIARMFGYTEKAFYQAPVEAQSAPKVDFNK